MKQLDFAHVPAAAFAVFDEELSNGDWASVESTRFDGHELHAAKPLEECRTLAIVKLRLRWAIASLLQAIEVSGDAKECGRHWNSLQKQLNACLREQSTSMNMRKRAAARRLQSELLRNRFGRTMMTYRQEVELGHHQVNHVSHGQGAADVASLGLVPLMLEISSATDTLANAIGYDSAVNINQDRKTAARAACAETFASAAYWLGCIAEYGSERSDRERAHALLASLRSLAEQYSSRDRTIFPAAIAA